MPSPHFLNAPLVIGCLEPVRTESQFLKFCETGGAEKIDKAKQDMERLTGKQIGDLFLVKSGVGVVLTWARVVDAEGRGADITHGFEEGEMATKLEDFVRDKHSSKRLLAVSWEDETGKTHLDLVRITAKLREVSGLPLPTVGGGKNSPKDAARGGI